MKNKNFRTLVGLLMLVMFVLLTACQQHEHAFGEWAVTTAASCTAEGVETRSCSCGETETRSISITEHVFGEWKTTTESTCTAEGIQTRTCSCGEIETQSINKKSHTYGEWKTTVEATCSKAGTETRTCNCGAETTRHVSRKSHNYGEWKTTTKATCVKEGVQTRTCKNCSSKETKVISKKEHSWKEATCAKPMTCENCGATEGTTTAHAFPDADFKCKRCMQEISAADYRYLVANSFRDIRREYSHAVATQATMILFRNNYGEVCIMARVYYKIGSGKFEDTFLYNFTQDQVIDDPISYYERLRDRSYGDTKLMYMDILGTLLEMEMYMLRGEHTYVVPADYLNA